MVGGESTVKMNKVCPRCFAERGVSVVMNEEKGRFFCPKDARHEFQLNADGFLEVLKRW